MKNRLNLLITFTFVIVGASVLRATKPAVTAEKQDVVLKVADYSEKPETVLFTTYGVWLDNYSGNLVKAKSFIDQGFVPMRVTVHNKRNEPVKISANSVGALVDIERVFRCFQSSGFAGAAIVAGLLGWVTCLVNIFESNAIRHGHGYWWYPVTSGTGCLTGLSVAKMLYNVHLNNKNKKQCLEQHILEKPIVIPPRGRVERLLLFDLNNKPTSLDFDVYDLYDSVVASFKKISLEDEQHDKK